MAENDVDSGQTSEGTAGAPTSAGSQGSGAQPGSFDAAKLQSVVEALSKQVSSLQGDKDRGVQKALKSYEGLKMQIAELDGLKKRGLDEDAAFEELGFRQDVRTLKEQLSKLTGSAPAQPVGNGSGGVDVAKVASEFDLDPNDPAVRLALSGAKSADEADVLAAKFVKAQKSKPTPSAADAGTTPGKTPSSMSQGDADAMFAEIASLIPHYSQNKSRIAELEKQLKAGGHKV